MKKVVSLLLSVVLMVGLVLPASAAETSYPTFESGVQEIQKYGNIKKSILYELKETLCESKVCDLICDENGILLI